ncbi:uncharacterized protein LOC132715555 [Ruditapes philippinarum]|uniref:uncharacterized protein LOC132715555 n=1 Tax=Ruditapes philippinarum TaxID=129788 RepID=UPI00295A708E|nr:uncharacterized protein LOC132715555 [Ruditapes philippinarum]
MQRLPEATWIRLAVWMAIGFLIYFSYGCWNSLEPISMTTFPSLPYNFTLILRLMNYLMILRQKLMFMLIIPLMKTTDNLPLGLAIYFLYAIRDLENRSLTHSPITR